MQFIVDTYRIDLYFPDYLLAIEYDENCHRFTQIRDKEREEFIINELDCTFIRINEGACVFNSINRIYKHIKNFKT